MAAVIGQQTAIMTSQQYSTLLFIRPPCLPPFKFHAVKLDDINCNTLLYLGISVKYIYLLIYAVLSRVAKCWILADLMCSKKI